MKIIHLSDLHLDKASLIETKNIVDKIIISLNKEEIDLILFTGDLINQGGQSYSNIENAFEQFKNIFVNPLLESLNLSRDRFIFTIGNHDIDRCQDNEYVEDGVRNKLIDMKSVSNFMTKPSGMNRVLSFKKFEEEFYHNIFEGSNFYQKKFESCYIINFENKKIGIVSLNAAWRCWDSKSDNENLILGIEQIENALNFLKECNIKIAIAHYDYRLMKDFEVEQIENLIMKNFNMYFCGHAHKAHDEYCENPIGQMFRFVAPGVLTANRFNAGKYKNGFSLIDYHFNEGYMNISHYFQDESLSFIIDKNYGKDGIWKKTLPLDNETEVRLATKKVIDDIKEDFPSLNKKLLSFDGVTNAPKSINEIFVMPCLCEKYELKDSKLIDNIEVREKTIDSLSELIKSRDNYVIMGIKESGKTILLDKIYMDISCNYYSYQYVPVLLNFLDIKSDIILNIKKCWYTNYSETTKVLSKNNVVILIDNMSFDDESKDKLLVLQRFLSKYPTVRFISTSMEDHNNEVTLYSKPQESLNFKRLEIQQFETKQIKNLIKKWFPENDQDETPKRIKALTNAFMRLHLPRTPFTISMFLWIIERYNSSYRPQNNALLIEYFIEELLKSNDSKLGLSENFDFKNKINLLSEIAYNMLNEDRDDYSLLYSEVIHHTENHLKKRMLNKSYNATHIISEIINVGILVYEESVIKFKFNCFFEFFLTKRMEIDSSFKQYVFDEERYLKYCNEINYYTGLHRNDDIMLKTIIDRLKICFEGLGHIFNQENSYDDYFNSDVSILKDANDDDLSEILPDKETEDEKDKANDVLLNSGAEVESVKKKKDSSYLNKLPKVLMLAMNILKNSEEVETQNLKKNSYDIIISCTIKYSILSKLICEEIFKSASKDINADQKNIDVLLKNIIPLLFQELLSDQLGTYKLVEIIQEKILSDYGDEKISDYERFLSVFTYCDIGGSNKKSIIKKFISSTRKKYIDNVSFIKLIIYYYTSKIKDDDLLINAIADLYIKMQSKSPQEKSNLIEKLRQEKKSMKEDL